MKTCWGDKTFYCSQAWYRSQLFLKKIPGNELEFSCQSTWVRIAFLFRFCFAIWVKWSGPAHQCYAPAMVTIKSHLLLELLPLACKSHYASFLKEIAYPKIIIYRTSYDSKPFFPKKNTKEEFKILHATFMFPCQSSGIWLPSLLKPTWIRWNRYCIYTAKWSR